jgi:hypothetical protein
MGMQELLAPIPRKLNNKFQNRLKFDAVVLWGVLPSLAVIYGEEKKNHIDDGFAFIR